MNPDTYDLDPEQLGLAVADFIVAHLDAFVVDRNVFVYWHVNGEKDGEITARVVVEDRSDQRAELNLLGAGYQEVSE